MSSTHSPLPDLLSAARYSPWVSVKEGVFSGFKPLGTDFGNGDLDGKIFQFDPTFPEYRKTKERARKENLDRIYPHSDLEPPAYAAITRFIVDRLVAEWSPFFRLREEGGRSILECTLTSERIVFSSSLELISATSVNGGPFPPYRDLFDALASQLQEDLAICRPVDATTETFASVHLSVTPVLSPTALTHVENGPSVRFKWTQTPLPLKVRIERQTHQKFPEVTASLLTIRSYLLAPPAEALANGIK